MIEYTEERFDSLLPTDPKEDRTITRIDEKTGEMKVTFSRIAHE